MTDTRLEPPTFRRSPRAVRAATFNRRMRGVDETEVREYLSGLADEIEAADAERAALRAEIDRLRAQGGGSGGKSHTEINSHAVALFSQAQQVADRLVEEAVQHARDLMMTAREQQREILEKAHAAAEAAAAKAAARAESHPTAPDLPVPDDLATPPDLTSAPGLASPVPPGLDPATAAALPVQPIPEVEYVRTFARVAQVQLKSVLDALAEQVDRLGQVPQVPEGHGDPAAPEQPRPEQPRPDQMRPDHGRPDPRDHREQRREEPFS